jgi:hypothetical protein
LLSFYFVTGIVHAGRLHPPSFYFSATGPANAGLMDQIASGFSRIFAVATNARRFRVSKFK